MCEYGLQWLYFGGCINRRNPHKFSRKVRVDWAPDGPVPDPCLEPKGSDGVCAGATETDFVASAATEGFGCPLCGVKAVKQEIPIKQEAGSG